MGEEAALARKVIFEVLDNQLRDNDPPITRQTFERLIKQGVPEYQARRMIGFALLMDLNEMLAEGRVFDEEKYTEKLLELPGEFRVHSTPSFRSAAGPELEDVLLALEHPDGMFPEEALLTAIGNKEAITPYLLEIVASPESLDPDYYGACFASILLAQFREYSAFPLIVDLFSSDPSLVDELPGGLLFDGLDRVLVTLAQGDVAAMLKMAETRGISESVRVMAIEAMVLMVATGQLARDEALGHLRHLFGSVERVKSDVWIGLVNAALMLYPEELLDEIADVYGEELMSDEMLPAELFEQVYQSSSLKSSLAALSDESRFHLVQDAVQESEWWAEFDEDDEDEDEDDEE